MIHQFTLPFADWLASACSHIPWDTTHALSSSIKAAWYLHPHQHVLEFIGLNVFLFGMVFYLGRKPWRLQVPAASPPAVSGITWLDVFTCCICAALAVAVSVYKYLTERNIYLLQPCHLLLYCLIYLSIRRGKSVVVDADNYAVTGVDFPSLVFNFYIHNMYGAWLALATPDTRDLKLPGEVFTFFFEHVVLVGLPLVFMYQRRFNVFEGRVLYLWAGMFLYHVDVLLPVSMVAGGNINYMMVPPKGVLRLCEEYYRIAMGGLCIILTALMRYGISGAWLALLQWCARSPTAPHPKTGPPSPQATKQKQS